MERDEAGTLARLQAIWFHQFLPRIAKYNGRVVKLMGDGALVEFASVVAAVQCAHEVQEALGEAVERETTPIRYRIGVNIGDVIVEGDDIFGEGVNVAARLQSMAGPGTVAVSSAVRDQVAGKIDVAFEDMGELTIKPNERPVHVYGLNTKGFPAPPAATLDSVAVSICVLPFENISGDPEQEYFSDGITEDIITDLSKVSALAVTARHTAFSYKGQSIDVSQLARRLGVNYVLEGSVRKAGERVRITAQLIAGPSNNHVWAERYDRGLLDIFALQAEISAAIAAALKLKLLPSEQRALQDRSTTNVEAYETYLMARQFAVTGNERHRSTTVRLCQHAVELDPNYARAWALLAISQANMRVFALDDTDNGAQAAERALALDPDLGEARAARGRVLTELGRLDEAWPELQRAMRLDPGSYDVNAAAARCALFRESWAEAIEAFERICGLAEADFWAPGMLIQCYEAIGDSTRAMSAAQRCLARVERLVALEPDHGAALGFGVTALATLGDAERAKSWIRRSLMLDPSNLRLKYNIGCALVRLGDHQAALDLFEPIIATSPREVVSYFQIDSSLAALRGEDRYKGIVAQAEARLLREDARSTNDGKPSNPPEDLAP
jgi:adenylate cyclase